MTVSLLVHVLLSICFCCSTVLESEAQYDDIQHRSSTVIDTATGRDKALLQVNRDLELKDLISEIGDVDGWSPEGEAQFAEGEDLFLLINGGAEIYNEYGFKEAVFETYSTEDGRSINLEIYKMDSQEAAYGMYTFKTTNEGTPIELGHDGWLESYYLNFWKGDFLITVIGLDTDAGVLDSVIKIARAVDSRLEFESSYPRIISYLPKEDLQANGITYLRGNLALFNRYQFDTEDIFGLKEGVIGKYDGYAILVFQYSDQKESMRWYESAKNHLKHSSRFSDFVDRNMSFEVSDRKDNRLTIKQYHDWILIILGSSTTNADRVLGLLEVKLAQ